MTKKLVLEITDSSVEEIVDVLEIIKHQLLNGFQQGFDSTFKEEQCSYKYEISSD